jgi:hypothetical protein
MKQLRRSQSKARLIAPAALALAVGLAGWDAAALAGEPIDGVDDKLGKNPGGSVASTPTNNNRTILFTGLERTAPNPNGGDTTPQNKYADDFTQPNRALLEKPDDPLQPGISDQGATGGLISSDRAPLPGGSAGNGNPPDSGQPPMVFLVRAFYLRAMLVEDAKGELPGRINAVTGQSAPDGAFAFTGLSPGSYVVEIVDAAGKIIGTSPPQRVASGGRLSGRLGQSGRVGDSFFDVFITAAPTSQKAAEVKSARSTVGASNAVVGSGSPDRARASGASSSGDAEKRSFDINVQAVNDAPSKVVANPVGGFGQGSPGSPGFGPNVSGMGGPASGMMSPPGLGPAAPAMSGPMGGPPGPVMGGGAMGRH